MSLGLGSIGNAFGLPSRNRSSADGSSAGAVSPEAAVVGGVGESHGPDGRGAASNRPTSKGNRYSGPLPDITANPIPSGSAIVTDFPKVITLNVGGHRFTTTIGTLRADANSMLGRMFSGEHPVLRDADGSFVIDRDGRQFYHVLNYLRDGSVPIGLSRVDRIELLREVDFYGLTTLYSIIGGPTVSAAKMSGGGGGPWLHSLIYDLARAEAAEFSASTHSHRVYARLRYGLEYSGDWIVSSPRNLSNVEYELYDACLARDPITALNKMGAAGFRPCVDPPDVPSASRSHSDAWEIMLYKDVYH